MSKTRLPDDFIPDYSAMDVDALRYELAGMYEELENTRKLVACIEQDIKTVEEELAKRLKAD